MEYTSPGDRNPWVGSLKDIRSPFGFKVVVLRIK